MFLPMTEAYSSLLVAGCLVVGTVSMVASGVAVLVPGLSAVGSHVGRLCVSCVQWH